MIRARYLAISLILILSIALGTSSSLSCAFPEIEITPSPSQPSPTPTPTPTPTNPNSNPINPEWTPPPEGDAPSLPDIASVVAKVKPSVVAINTEVTTYDIFNRPLQQPGAGSGWIIDESGIIVTNNHVVEGADSITITLDDGRTFPVDLSTIATDPTEDLAVLKIDAENLVATDIGNSSQLRVGDWLVAIGNSLGLGISAKEGIVSRQGVKITVSSTQTLFDLIETSAAINPGNSGGPLVNLAGEVIGITSAKIATVGVEGMGYAISTSTAIPIIEALINQGYVVRPWLGVGYYTVDQYVVLRYQLAVTKGVLITQIVPGSPADRAGLEAGDVIVNFGGEEIIDAQELTRAIHSSQIAKSVEIGFWRDTTERTTSAILSETPPP